MPLYDYRCKTCDHYIEDVFFKMDEASFNMELDCPTCGKTVHEMSLAGRAADDWGQGKFFEHLSPSGETFYSRNQFRDYLKRHGLRERDSYSS